MKDVTIKPHKAVLKMTSDEAKITVKPGDTTVNHLLAFFTLVLTPLFIIIEPILNEVGLVERAVLTITVTLLLFLLIMRTRAGIILVQKMVNLIKDTEL